MNETCLANDIVAGLGFNRGFNFSLITTITTSVAVLQMAYFCASAQRGSV